LSGKNQSCVLAAQTEHSLLQSQISFAELIYPPLGCQNCAVVFLSFVISAHEYQLGCAPDKHGFLIIKGEPHERLGFFV
jgi:hypothetical protein